MGLGGVTEGAMRSNGVALIVANVDACLPVDDSTCQGGPKTGSPRPITQFGGLGRPLRMDSRKPISTLFSPTRGRVRWIAGDFESRFRYFWPRR